MKVAAGITMTHNPFGEDYWASCLRENLTSSSYGEGLETDHNKVPRQSLTRQTYYRDEKIVLEVEQFHGQTVNSIIQELLAAPIMTVISRTMMVLASDATAAGAIEPQFKNAILTLASEAAVLAPEDPESAVIIFNDILQAISRVKYYRPKRPRPPAPRVTKRAINKWATARLTKVAHA
jgi:hypothetical protein